MKEFLKTTFAWDKIAPIVIVVFMLLLFEFATFPLLTAALTFFNLLGLVLLLAQLIFLFSYIKSKLKL